MTVSFPQISSAEQSLHVAIIMDGNGRWAKKRHLPRTAGHKKGADAVHRTVVACRELGVTHLTLFGFSTENWKRPVEEVNDLMGLLRLYLKKEVKKLHKEDVRIQFIGDRDRLDQDIIEAIDACETLTAQNQTLVLTIALSYGGRAEITRAVQILADKVQSGEMAPADITEQVLDDQLFTKEMPDPDLLIRTSGEKRISNFLLWQMAYTEFVFQDVLWPDYDKKHLEDALNELSVRDRRFGMIHV